MLSAHSRLVTSQLCILYRQLGMHRHEYCKIIGLSSPQFDLIIEHEYFIDENSIAWEKAKKLIRSYSLILLLVDNNVEDASHWLHSPKEEFDCQNPVDYMKQVDGLNHVHNYLSCLH